MYNIAKYVQCSLPTRAMYWDKNCDVKMGPAIAKNGGSAAISYVLWLYKLSCNERQSRRPLLNKTQE